MSIDIIIPIYNAYEELCLCVESVLKHTDLQINRLILVDDQSPDERIFTYLKTQEGPGIVVLQNEENLGFSESVNHAIRYSDRDVILLNSDTVVTQNWVEKMTTCAYSNRNIATVTPFSNNATICSLPEYLQDNTVPAGFTIESYAKLVEEASTRLYPPVCTAIGFCMYIKRTVLDEIGLFDAETFGKGYGEENDFCYRASELGYTHVVCDDTYIYHSGSMSFLSEQKRQLIQQNLVKLAERYPKLFRENEVFCAQNPLWPHQEMVHLRSALQNNKKTILFVAHRSSHEDAVDNLGGTQIHVKDLRKNLCDVFNCIELGLDAGFIRLSIYADSKEFELHFPYANLSAYPALFSKDLRQIFETVLDGLNVDIVHVHHTKYLSLDIFELAAERDLPLFATIHDYYAACPKMNFFDHTGSICLNKPESNCKTCLQEERNLSIQVNFMEKWRKEYGRCLALCKEIFAPSASAKFNFASVYPELASKIQVIGHGVDPLAEQPTQPHQKESEKLRLAFVGGLCEAKGSKIIYQLFKSPTKQIEWYTIGQIGEQQLLHIQQDNIHHLGPYTRNELPQLLRDNKIDLVAIFSAVPETFCYVISETLFCGLPVICTDLGALGERVRNMNCGWLVPTQPTAKQVLDLLQHIANDPSEYAHIVQNVQSLSIKTATQMAQEYAAIYQAQPAVKHTAPSLHCNRVLMEALLFAHDQEQAPAASSYLARIATLETELFILHNSLTFRLLAKFQQFERFMHAFISKIYSSFVRK